MTRHLTLFGIAMAATLGACKGDTQLSAIDNELSLSPTLKDLGSVPVGEVVCFDDVKIAHEKGGEIKLSNISVINIEGDFFYIDGEPPNKLPQSEEIKLPLCYAPTTEGYHRATVEVTYSADEPAVIDVRGRGVLPDATLWPLGLDFGPVDVGGQSTRQLTIANQSDLDLTVSEANVSNGVFSVVTAVPFTVGGGDEMVIQLAFDPTDLTPQTGSLTLRAGDVGLPQVALRGNDCDNGDPDAYDQDGDGYTMCGGDCNDDNIDANPGAIEVPNGEDDNCNGTADEGTVLYDDDGDGFCESLTVTCTYGPSGGGDCSDSADVGAQTDQVYPGATEIMDNGIDDDCDGTVDQGTTDADGDGYSPAGGDCDDNDPTAYPGAPELPDFVNNDCDLLTDEGTTYFDDDGDGYCDHATTCSDGSLVGDCDDDSVDSDGVGGPDGRPTNPGAVEQPDWRDNDCDGTVDEGTIRYDDDGDGYTEVGGDCNDSVQDLDGDGVMDGAAFSPALGTCP